MGEQAPRGGRRAFRLAFVVAATVTGGCNSIFGIHQGTPEPPCYDPSNLLIDDMEDGLGDICNLAGRQGSWYTVGDGTSTTLEPASGMPFIPTMIPGGRESSRYAARLTGSGFTDWGALMGFSLDGQAVSRTTYDASSTGGITFWMKANVAVSVNLLIPATVLETNGGDCVDSATNPNCNSHFSFKITAPSSDWVKYQVPFSSLAQQYGGTAAWNPKLLLAIEFLVGPGAPFDVWVDDVSFYYCSTSTCKPTCADPAFAVTCPASGSYPAGCWTMGTDCSAVATWCSDPNTIDDMEDGDRLICNTGGRTGDWFTIADGAEGTLSPAQGATFTMTPIPGGRGDSRMAARMTASGFTTYAQMGLFLKNVSGIAQPYDASATGGITFWMKTNAPIVDVNFLTSETVPVSAGGLCSDIATTFNCDNAFIFNITNPHPDWFQYYVPYSALSQANYKADPNGNTIAGSAAWDPTSVTYVQFAVYQPTNVEVWVDDVSFYDCSNETCVPTCADPAAPVACPALGAVPANCWPAGTDCSTVTTLLGTNAELTSVWGSGPDDVWAVALGLQGSPLTASPTVLHWDGSAWSSVESGTTHPLWDIWGSTADDVWAVGDFGTVAHWNGTAWSASSAGLNASLNSVWGSSSGDVWAVGTNGAIAHWDGATWSAATGVSSKDLYHLWGSGPADVWAVGDGGTIIHWDGTAWSASASATDSALGGVWGSGPADVYAVGNTATGEATILHWDGQAWTTVSTPAGGYPSGVWGSGPDDVWVVGDSIVHWDGAAWTTVSSPPPDYLLSVWGTGASDAWTVGFTDTLMHWNGTLWSAVPTAGIQR